MKTIVVDASVLLKIIFPEKDSGKAEELITMKDNFDLSILVPDIFRYEFFQEVTRKAGAQAAHDGYFALTDRQISIIPLAVDLIETAQEIMQKYPKIAFYDATYHALAKAYNTILVTADEKYYEKAKHEGDIQLLESVKL